MKIENKDYKKLYEEALERAKIKRDEYIRLDGQESYVPQDIEYIFPELAESEDEKIRKWIINEIKIKHHNLDEDNVDFVDKAIVWLEKQQKSADIPKFKAGDWVINEHGFVMQIVDVQDRYYVYMYKLEKLSATIEQMEDSCHLWGIRDAKNGDMIVTPNSNIFIFKEIRNNCHIYDHCGMYFDSLIINSCVNGIGAKELPDDYKPATKEQSDLLFQKMKEAGYEWDAEIKELKKVESDSSCNEDDDEVFKAIYEDLHSYYGSLANANMFSYKKELYEKKWENAKKWLEEHVA